ncbi:cation:proton antiporter [Lacimicrobium alkaliphilum]|uniref:Sodium:proton exchanger n=1 Tax=Lacimicrobium alkaliphilum TaxID=1526571 RepID=A0A0U3AXM0_9ALTE|nr:cation:proton antiporter family protein [Lacimicrobium alkaliphilum]ALS97632.1 sodium:proton exchanger [Lacimicrobium alkaliphilum]
MLELIRENPFYELTTLLALAALVGVIGQLMRQPMIVGFIAVGVLAGPSVLNIVHSADSVALLAELAIAVLLFLVGLKLDLKLIRTLGPVALATGLGQVAFTSAIGFGIGLAVGLDTITSAYVAVALTFSSTIIIVKLLSDKKEVDSLHGQIAIGFLIVQDLVVVVAMITLSAIGVGGTGNPDYSDHLLRIAGGGLLMLILVLVFARFLATPLLKRIAKNTELLLVFSIALAAVLAALGHGLGFSMELGGLLAGVALASTPYRESIVSRLSSLRDFLLLFFFISLGTQLDLSLLGEQLIPALVFSLFVLIGNPLIVVIIMGWMGYRKRTGFLAGLTVAQISEFSLIFVAMGVTIGHLTNEVLGLVTLVGLITIALSVYMITYSHSLYLKLEKWLTPFERRNPYRESQPAQNTQRKSYDAIIYGLGRFGSEIAETLSEQGYSLAVVDFNPDVVQKWNKRGIDAFYGDACDPDFIEHLPLSHTHWIISTLPRHETGLTHEDPSRSLISAIRHHGFEGKIALASYYPGEKQQLDDLGVDLVLMPFKDAAAQAAHILTRKSEND